jgi:hypothetical protein
MFPLASDALAAEFTAVMLLLYSPLALVVSHSRPYCMLFVAHILLGWLQGFTPRFTNRINLCVNSHIHYRFEIADDEGYDEMFGSLCLYKCKRYPSILL